jgi:transposase
MIVIGVEPHKQTHTLAAVDRATGELRGEPTVGAREEGHARLLEWARSLDPERLFALEDCRPVSCRLERFLIGRGERVVRVPPKLMAGARRSARQRGKSDAIDALAVARAAIREPELPEARLEGASREMRLLLDHREDLVAERTRIQNRLGCAGTCTSSIRGSSCPSARSTASRCSIGSRVGSPAGSRPSRCGSAASWSSAAAS